MIEFIFAGLLGSLGAVLRNFRNSLIHKRTEREPTKPYWIFMIIMGLFIGNFGILWFGSLDFSNSILIILLGYVGTDLISALFTIFTGKFLFSKRKR